MLSELSERIKDFNNCRDWNKFHNPKNLAIGINLESSELLEIFIWLSEFESQNLTSEQLKRIKDEIGDIMIYIINLSEKLKIDPIKCAFDKLIINNEKYPVEKAFGSSKKYNEI